MESRSRNIGDEEIFNVNGRQIKGIIATISKIVCGDMTGVLESYVLDGYGRTQDYFYPSDYDFNTSADRRRDRSLMPPEFVYKRGKDFDWSLYGENMEPVKKIANSFVTQFSEYRKQGRGLYLSSKTKGSGKTLLACCLANEIIQRYDISVKFVSALDYIEMSREKNETSQEGLKCIRESSLLILDDIGAEWSGKADWTSTVMSRLIDFRDKHILSTIYTSNYDMHQLPGYDRMVDRIVGHSIPVVMPEFSVRRDRAERHTKDFLKSILAEPDNVDIFK